MESINGLFDIDNWKNLTDSIPKPLIDGTAETFLETLLLCMQAKLAADSRYRKNIKDFTASYMFMSQDKCVAVNVRFGNGGMCVRENFDENANVFIKFKDGKALMNFSEH